MAGRCGWRWRSKQVANFERCAAFGGANKRERCLVAFVQADATAHAGLLIDNRAVILQVDGSELAVGLTFAAGDAQVFVHLAEIAGGGKHWRAVLVGMQRPAAAFAAVADGIEAVEHGIFEEGVVDVAAGIFGAQDVDRFLGSDPAGALGMVFFDEAGERVADDQADIQRQAGIFARGAAGAVQGQDVLGVLENEIARLGIRNDFFQARKLDRFVDGYQLGGSLERNDFAVIAFGKTA